MMAKISQVSGKRRIKSSFELGNVVRKARGEGNGSIDDDDAPVNICTLDTKTLRFQETGNGNDENVYI